MSVQWATVAPLRMPLSYTAGGVIHGMDLPSLSYRRRSFPWHQGMSVAVKARTSMYTACALDAITDISHSRTFRFSWRLAQSFRLKAQG